MDKLQEIVVKTYQDMMGDTTLMAKIPDVTVMIDDYMGRDLLHEVIRQIAERYVSEHYTELVSKLDQQAIANLAVAESGRKIAEEIRSRPTVLHDGCKTTVNRYSVF